MELNEILTIARNLLKARMDSLQNDVKRCIFGADVYTHTQAAPFPALLYCFSTIDLLGALYGGNATGKQDKEDKKAEYRTSVLSLNYMNDVMQYPQEKANLLQKVFRHKIVHLAQPKPVIKHSGKLYTWCYEHNNRGIHLQEVPTEKADAVTFCISIWSLVEDIVDSVYKPNGYLHQLENKKALRDKFVKAYTQIFEHEPLI